MVALLQLATSIIVSGSRHQRRNCPSKYLVGTGAKNVVICPEYARGANNDHYINTTNTYGNTEINVLPRTCNDLWVFTTREIRWERQGIPGARPNAGGSSFTRSATENVRSSREKKVSRHVQPVYLYLWTSHLITVTAACATNQSRYWNHNTIVTVYQLLTTKQR